MDNDLIQDTNLDLLQVNAVEVEYSGIAPINVDNQEHTISLDPSALSSKLDTSAFDEWTATHSAGEEYSAGEGIDITDHVISYTGDPGDATPWISGNKIITSADTMQPGEFIQVLSSFDLSGNKNHFITVKGQGYYFPTNDQLKERVGVDDYLPLSSFSSYTASIADNLQNNWNYTNSAYSQSLNNYYNKLDISAFSSWSSEHSGDFLTKESADTLYQPIGDYQTAGNYQTAGDYLSATDSALFYPMEGNPSGFLTGVDLSNYYEKNETSSKEEIENAITSVENIINNLSGEYYPLTSNPSGYLTAHQSLDDYQKTADMTAYQEAGDYYSASNPSGFITGVDLSNYYEKNETSSKEEISDALTSKLDATAFDPNAFYPSSNPSGFITGVDLTDYVERDELTAYQEKGDYYSASNPSGFITGVDLSNYYEKNETSSKEEISAALTSKLDESAFTAYTANADTTEYTAGDNIDITDHVISGKDWTSTIESATSGKLDTSSFTAYTATAVQGIEYTGIAPIDVNNTTHQISADVWTLSARNGILIFEDNVNKITTLDFNGSTQFYPLTGNPSGFLTTQQLTAYQPTADMTAYYKKDETSSKEQISAAFNRGDYLPLSATNAAVGNQVNVSALGLAQGAQVSAIDYSFAQGHMVSANHIASVQGISATAYDCAMSQGYEVSARQCAFAQGAQTTADYCSLAQGGHCSAWSASIAQGEYNTASLYSQAFGDHTRADDHTMAIGAYNKTSANTPFVIGNGTSDANRSDLFIINSTGGVSAVGKISANGVELGAGGGGDTIDLSAGEGISIVETADKVVISNNISAGSNMSFVYDSETNKIRIDAADAFPITATDGNTTWSADCKASAFTMGRNTSRTDIGAFGFEYRQAPSVNVSGSWYDLAILMEKFKYAIPVEAVANSGLATGQNILYVVTGN